MTALRTQLSQLWGIAAPHAALIQLSVIVGAIVAIAIFNLFLLPYSHLRSGPARAVTLHGEAVTPHSEKVPFPRNYSTLDLPSGRVGIAPKSGTIDLSFRGGNFTFAYDKISSRDPGPWQQIDGLDYAFAGVSDATNIGAPADGPATPSDPSDKDSIGSSMPIPNFNFPGLDQSPPNLFIDVPTSAVPEPATWSLLFSGFFALGSIVRTSRRKQSVGIIAVKQRI